MPIIDRWPPTTASNVERALSAAAKELPSLDARVEHYHVPQGGYSCLTGSDGSEAFSLEARVMAANRRPGYTVWAAFQVFDPHLPNLAMLRFVERRDRDGAPDDDPARPLYGLGLDRTVCRTFMPAFNRALNDLDPSKRGRSLYVTCFHGRLGKINLVQQPWLATGLFRRYRSDGQAAIVYCDFHEPLGKPLVYLTKTITARGNVHLIPRTTTPSAARTLLRGPDGQTLQLGRMSTAINRGVTLARHYLA
ncbi:hypothetical protein [Actinomadura gamaensis]|uniref:Uncharacterized protein n=1 Tax=Actinomadura gamaensis TaxID=1763541 RepID=A0ABV9U0S1_9ACTN